MNKPFNLFVVNASSKKGYYMKIIRRHNFVSLNTIEVYASACNCVCTCGCECLPFLTLASTTDFRGESDGVSSGSSGGYSK